MLFYELSVKESLERFKTDADKGLSSSEVLKRRKRFGKNELEVKGTPVWKRILEPFLDIFMAILIVALILSAIQGAWTEVIMITIIIVINAIIDYVQQFSTERILRGLRQKTVQKADVLRNGDKLSVDAWELVPGDVVFLDEGDRIPADGRIINESGLLTNESMLTGESDSVAKDSNKLSGVKKVYERRNMVFSGSFVVTGKARMLVVATGNNTEYGRIASLASGAEQVSPIQEKISKLIFKIAITVVVLAVFVLIIQLARGIDFLAATEFTLAMIVSAVPESLPIAISVVLALGARRMAKKNALIKEMRAIESIGIVTTIASDKTGTLTENKLSVTNRWQLAESRDFMKFIAMAALPDAVSNDALDVAMVRYVAKGSLVDPAKSYAFDQDLKISGNLYSKNHLVIKGAPEAVIERCRLSEGTSQKIEAEINAITAKGHKAIAIADVKLDHEINELNRLPKSAKFNFIGLISVADTIRKEAPEAIRDAQRAGVKVKMITGDH
ncbi:MAG: HAD-IC family P-type ATPase, partial [Candidatus Saccharimonadales bacterium]